MKCSYLAFTFLIHIIGPAETLFKQVYFERVRDALKPGGIMCMQGRLSDDSIKNVFACVDLV